MGGGGGGGGGGVGTVVALLPTCPNLGSCSISATTRTRTRLGPPTSTTNLQLQIRSLRIIDTTTTRRRTPRGTRLVSSCLPPPSTPPSYPNTKLFVSGLSFNTTEESLRNAFKDFGNLLQLDLVMDKIANRPRGFAFLRYATEEESLNAIEGMHGKFLDGRVIFVEIAKPKSELSRGSRQNQRQF